MINQENGNFIIVCETVAMAENIAAVLAPEPLTIEKPSVRNKMTRMGQVIRLELDEHYKFGDGIEQWEKDLWFLLEYFSR